jgi:competence protein ComEC
VRCPAVPIFLALMTGALMALALPGAAMPWLGAGAVAAWQAATVALAAARPRVFTAAVLGSLALSAAAAALHTDGQRAHASIRAVAPGTDVPPNARDPVVVEGVLVEDAAANDDGTLLRIRVDRVTRGRGAVDLEGTIAVSVGGQPDPARAREWTRGRRIRAPVLLRRPSRYFNTGVPDAERASLRRGTAVVGAIKSHALVEVLARANRGEEALAAARRRVRGAIARASASDPEAGAVVTAILIGDRVGLSDDVERRMQRAGTYHVIAISGGNVALFATLAWASARLMLRSRRLALVVAMLIVAGYGLLVGTGASVGRAVAAALLFLFATFVDQRAPPLNAIALVGIGFLLWDPLALADLGFVLSFGATAGILIAVPGWVEAARARVEASLRQVWLARAALAACALLAATVAAEIALLPIQASAFQRLTLAGLALNFIAIPAMAVVQMGGMAIVFCDLAEASVLMPAAAAAARMGARALIDSAALVDAVPALTWRVAAPPPWLFAAYAVPCALLAWRRWPRMRAGLCAWAALAAVAIALSAPVRTWPDGRLRVTMFDVGQAEAIAVRLPSGRNVLIDAAGQPGRFDIGGRVLVPALLARGVTRLDMLVITHPDIDHAGGAPAVMADLRPPRVIEGIAPVLNDERDAVAAAAFRAGATVEALRAGGSFMRDGVLFRVLHPPPPDWERPRVRNDDSLVLEVRFGVVSIVLTGDAGEAVEGSIAAGLAPARLRILKVGHHGSRSSTSQAFLDAVRPDVALISAGRGNLYGHPSPAVLARLRAAGVETFRTDRDGQIDLTTDGRQVDIRTHGGRRWTLVAR